MVYPAAHLPVLAKQNGAKIVEINVEHAFTAADTVILDKAASAMKRLLEAVKTLKSTSDE
ncbi:MAG: hypothetical protein WBV21_14245 [Desulfobacterales bacterium]